METSPENAAPGERGTTPLDMGCASVVAEPEVSDGKAKGWPQFWAVVLVDNMAGIISQLILPDIAVASFNGGIDPCAGAGAGTPECIHALAQLANAQAMSSFIGGIIAFLCNPLVGSAADRFGRRPMFILSFVSSKLVLLALVGVDFFGMSVYYYFVAMQVLAIVPSGVLYNLWINDMTRPEDRAQMFGRLSAATNLEGIAVPFLTYFCKGRSAVCATVVLRLTAVMIVLFCMHESRPGSQRQLGGRQTALIADEGSQRTQSRMRGLLTLCSHRILRQVMLLGFIGIGTGAGISAIYFPYLKERFGTTIQSVGPLVAVSTLSNVIVQLFFIKPMEQLLGLKWLCVLSFVFGTLASIGSAVAPTYNWLYLVTSFAGLSQIAIPAFTALISKVAESAQDIEAGVALGALQSVVSLVTIMAPPLYSAVFSASIQATTPFPQAPYVLGVISNLCCIVMLVSIPSAVFPSAIPVEDRRGEDA